MERSQAQEERRQKSIASNRLAAQPVLAELSQAGFDLIWIEDLYTKRLDYKSAIPILLRWLPRLK
jgi:hypothetical protein